MWGVFPAPPFRISVLVVSKKCAAHVQLHRDSWKLQVTHSWKSNPGAFSASGNCISLVRRLCDPWTEDLVG